MSVVELRLRIARQPMAELKGARVFQSLLHARPAYPRGLFRRAATMPMRLKAHRVMMAKLLEGAELCGPVEKSLVDGRPLDLAIRVAAIAGPHPDGECMK
jgi:hypothetical protein